MVFCWRGKINDTVDVTESAVSEGLCSTKVTATHRRLPRRDVETSQFPRPFQEHLYHITSAKDDIIQYYSKKTSHVAAARISLPVPTVALTSSWALKICSAVNEPPFQNKRPCLFNALLLCCVQVCPALCDPMDYSPPGSSVRGMLQARILERAAIYYSSGSYWPRDQNHSSASHAWQADSLPLATWEGFGVLGPS